MVIKGLQKTTLLDYPGKVACIIFYGGCNFHCPFCHNPELVNCHSRESGNPDWIPDPLQGKQVGDDRGFNKLPTIPEDEILQFLQTRVGKLEGVVITGGEPTIHHDLPKFLEKIKDIGFSVKLDTNGTNPEMAGTLIKQNLIDYVAMDYKGPLAKYYQYVGEVPSSKFQVPVQKTLKMLIKSGIDFELRTTVVPTLHTKEDLIQMAQDITSLSPKPHTLNPSFRWYLQNFRPNKCLDKSFEKIKPYPKSFFDQVLPELKKLVPEIEVRGR